MQPTIKRGRMKSYAIQMDPCVYVVQINESGLVSSPSHNSCILIDLSDLWESVPRCIVCLQLLRLLAGHHHTTVYLTSTVSQRSFNLKCTAVLAHQPHQERTKSIWWPPKGNKSIFRHSSESRAGSLDSTSHEQSIHGRRDRAWCEDDRRISHLSIHWTLLVPYNQCSYLHGNTQARSLRKCVFFFICADFQGNTSPYRSMKLGLNEKEQKNLSLCLFRGLKRVEMGWTYF